jgi:hypothetical protein
MGSLICSDSRPDVASDPLQADCTRCAGLCCILLPFDADQGFAFSKLAGVPCPNLTAEFRCCIHVDLTGQGFPGCALYDCHGAGQYVTELLQLGANWYESEGLQREAYGLFATARALHARLKGRRNNQG